MARTEAKPDTPIASPHILAVRGLSGEHAMVPAAPANPSSG